MEISIGKIRSGMIDLLILVMLSEKDMYGYEITQFFKTSTEGEMAITEERIYIIMQQFEKRKYVSRYTVKVNERRKRHYYHLEPAGMDCLDDVLKHYGKVHRITLELLADAGLELPEGK